MELTKLKMLAEAAKKPAAPVKKAPAKVAPVKKAPVKAVAKAPAKVAPVKKSPAKVSKMVFNKAEAVQAAKDIQGIRNVVDDALSDLMDKLGKGGNLDKIMKASGAYQLDTVKDKNGKAVMAAIVEKTAAFRSEIDQLLTEAELMIHQVSLTEGLITEAKDYSDSGEFTDEFYGIVQSVAKIKQLVKNPRWMAWMKTTDSNFATSTVEPAKNFVSAINDADRALSEIDEEFDKAS